MNYQTFDREIDDNLLLDLEVRGHLEGDDFQAFLRRVRDMRDDNETLLASREAAKEVVTELEETAELLSSRVETLAEEIKALKAELEAE